MAKKRIKDAQPHLPGMAPKRDNVLHKAAESFADARQKKAVALSKQNEAEQSLIDVMLKKKVEHYNFDNVKLTLKPGHDVSCKVEDPDSEDE